MIRCWGGRRVVGRRGGGEREKNDCFYISGCRVRGARWLPPPGPAPLAPSADELWRCRRALRCAFSLAPASTGAPITRSAPLRSDINAQLPTNSIALRWMMDSFLFCCCPICILPLTGLLIFVDIQMNNQQQVESIEISQQQQQQQKPPHRMK